MASSTATPRYRGRRLTSKQAKEGVATIIGQLTAAFETRHIDMSSKDDRRRVIYLGASGDALYPTPGNRWSDNRAVAEAVVRQCRARGYDAMVIPQRYSVERRRWTELKFKVMVPAGHTITMY